MCQIEDEINKTGLPLGTKASTIQKIISKNNLKDITVQVSAGSEKGDNYVGIIHSVKVTGKDCITNEVKTLNLILKSAVWTGVLGKLISVHNVFEREILMYKEILPEYDRLQQSFAIHNRFNKYAKIYDSCLIEQDEFLIMDNKKILGFVLTDRKKTLDFYHCELIMKNLGIYHSLSFAMKQHKPEVFEAFKKKATNLLEDYISSDDFLDQCKLFTEKVTTIVDSVQDKSIAEKFYGFSKENGIFNTLKRFNDPEYFDDYSVIIHGDCWSSNILFKYGDRNNPTLPTDVCFLDWQVSRFTSPVVELSYFFYNCTDEEILDQHFDQLIQIYYNSLSESLREMNCVPEILFPFEKLQEHLQKYFRFGVGLCIQLINFFISEQEELPDFRLMNKLELDINSINQHVYNKRVEAILKHAVKNGFM